MTDDNRDEAQTSITVLSPTEVPPGRHSLLVRVFVDNHCDTMFDLAEDKAIPNVSVRLVFFNGAEIEKDTLESGLLLFSGFDPGQGVEVSVDLPASYRGRALLQCANSPPLIDLASDAFGPMRSKFVTFRLRVSGEVAGP